MPNTLGKNLNLNLCCTKVKLPLMFSQSSAISTTPTPPIQEDQSRALSSSNLIIRHFNSLYEDARQDNNNNNQEESYYTTPSSLSAASDDEDGFSSAADFATAFASRRFFFSTPGPSNSIVDSAGDRHGGGDGADVTLFGNSIGIAVPKFSLDPYTDFRRSMQEMLEARGHHSRKSNNNNNSNDNNWEFLHELLLCYLALNPKSTHKFIIGAFSDLVVSLMPSSPDGGGQRENGRDVIEIPAGT